MMNETEVVAEAPPRRRSLEERKELLGRHVAMLVVQQRRVESQGDFNAVLVQGHKPNHVLHLLVTLVSCGLWAPVWLGLALLSKETRELVEVDEWGNPRVQKL